ncbi:hypothetical protein WJX73_003795 [Symbiochloris irregularis]|uniref:ER membrane protein complex subunit 6 n=1 Tax=Symbiochloris irregularis TaxID=706552 RepID=A0AAW1P0R9_9CHLO
MAPQKPLGSDFYLPTSLRNNADVINFLRTSGSLVAGLSVGILGVTGWIGFLYYAVVHALISGLVILKAGHNPQQYFQSRSSLFLGDVFSQTSLLTFILFWTVSHNFVHLF